MQAKALLFHGEKHRGTLANYPTQAKGGLEWGHPPGLKGSAS